MKYFPDEFSDERKSRIFIMYFFIICNQNFKRKRFLQNGDWVTVYPVVIYMQYIFLLCPKLNQYMLHFVVCLIDTTDFTFLLLRNILGDGDLV